MMVFSTCEYLFFYKHHMNILFNGENFQSSGVTLTFITEEQMSNSSKLYSIKHFIQYVITTFSKHKHDKTFDKSFFIQNIHLLHKPN